MKRSGRNQNDPGERVGFIRNILFELPDDRKDFPFNIPALKGLRSLDLHPKVTFFVGENGSGKSTLLEAIAVGIKAVAMGSADLARSPGTRRSMWR